MTQAAGEPIDRAFVEIGTDTRNFDRELNTGVEDAYDKVEKKTDKLTKDIVKSFDDAGSKITTSLTTKLSKGGDDSGNAFKRALSRGIDAVQSSVKIGADIAAGLARGIAGGVQAIPPQAQAAIVAGLVGVVLLAAPLISGAIAAAVSAGVALGFVGVGAALASQFEDVQREFTFFINNARNRLVRSADVLVDPILSAFDIFDARIAKFEPVLESIFTKLSKFIEPLADAFGEIAENFLKDIDSSLDNAGPALDGFVGAIDILLSALGESLNLLASVGPEGAEALKDLATIVADTILNVTRLIVLFTELYHTIKIGTLAVTGPFQLFVDGVSDTNVELGTAIDRTKEYELQQKHLITTTDAVTAAEKKQLDELSRLNRELRARQDAIRTSISLEIDLERALDNLTEAFRENGRTIDIGTEAGRRNQEAIGRAFDATRRKIQEQIDLGKISFQQAQAQLDAEIAKIRERLKQLGLAPAVIEQIIKKYKEANALAPIDPGKLAALEAEAKRVKAELDRILRAYDEIQRHRAGERNTSPSAAPPHTGNGASSFVTTGGNTTSSVNFGPGAIPVSFNGVVPTETQAFQTGQAIGAGIADIVAKQNVRTSVRTI